MISRVLLVDTSRKFRKNTRFWGKIHLQASKNFEIHLPKCRGPLPQKIALIISITNYVFAPIQNTFFGLQITPILTTTIPGQAWYNL